MKNAILIFIIIFVNTGLLFASDPDQEWRKVIDLRGQWRFAIGDNMRWADADFDDSDWEMIFAPSKWEDEGYPGYDGFAWYRKKFTIKNVENLYALLGTIDDVDEVYINGKLIGFSGHFPPDYYTAFSVDRVYHIPAPYLYTDRDNVIAIRVYDAELEGGLIRGKLGIYEKMNLPFMIKSLEGPWKFALGDDEERAEYNYDDSRWNEILVPSPWESQGYDYDGLAWYRLHFRIDPKYKNEKLVLMLGKIDDLDETFVNGHYVGRTGHISKNVHRINLGDEYLVVRAYKLDNDDLYFDRENILAVRVYDGLITGGIYDGPIGIVTYDEYLNWRKNNRDNTDVFFKDFFRLFK